MKNSVLFKSKICVYKFFDKLTSGKSLYISKKLQKYQNKHEALKNNDRESQSVASLEKRNTEVKQILNTETSKQDSRELMIIKKSQFFDQKWYLKTYSDVANQNCDAANHYLNYGWREGRDPGPHFDGRDYLDFYEDVREAGICPLLHFEEYGKSENRRIFDYDLSEAESEFSKFMKLYLNKNKENSKKCLLFSHEMTLTGAPIALVQLAEICRELGYTVLLISKNGGELEKRVKEISSIEYFVCNRIDEFNSSAFLDLRNEFDFAVCNTVVLARLASRIQNLLPTLLWVHEAKEGYENIVTGHPLSLCNVKITNILRHIDNIAFVSEYALDFYRNKIKLNKNVYLIHNYIEDVKFKLSASKEADNEINICYIGAVADKDPRKNLPLLIDAFKKVSAEYNTVNLRLQIVGQKHDYASIIENQMGIVLHGQKSHDEVLKIINDCQIVVVPSRIESCSMVALEGACLGKSLILSSDVGAKYMFEDNKSCLMFKTDDLQGLCSCLKRLILDKNLRIELGKNSRLSYEKSATREVQKECLMALFENLKRTNARKRKNSLSSNAKCNKDHQSNGPCIPSSRGDF